VVVPVNPATERVHIVRRYVRESLSLATCLRYDRAHDRFVEWNAT
jgi:hypothetical protein